MKNQNRQNTSFGAIRWVVAGMVASAVCVAHAETYGYVNTGAATGSWADAANWSKPGVGFPGSIAGNYDVANVNNAVSGDYAVDLDQALPGNIDDVNIANASGTATVKITSPLTIYKTTSIGQNARLVIDGVAVTGGVIGFGPYSELVLNNGGSRVLTGNGTLSVGSGTVGAVTALVTSASAQITGNDILDYGNRTLQVGAHANFGANLLRVEKGAVLTNLTLQAGFAGFGNAVVIDDAKLFTIGHITLGDGNGGGCGGLLLLDNGAEAYAGSNPARTLGTGNYLRDNRVVISNGSKLYTYNTTGYFGRGGTNNTVTVTGAGSLFDMGGNAVRVGCYFNNVPSANNALRILDGGVVTNAVGLQVNDDAGPGFGNELVVDNGKLYGSNFLIAPNGRDSVFRVTGENALVAGPGSNTGITFAERKSGGHYFTGCYDNVMTVSDGGTVSNFTLSVAMNGANMVGNRLEVTNGGRLFLNVGNGRFTLAGAVSNAWDNVAAFSGGGLLEAREIFINAGATGPVHDNYMTFENSILQFPIHNPNITLNGDAFIKFENSTISYRGVTTDGGGIDVANMNGNVAKLSFVGDTALRLSASKNRSDANATYTFDKGLGANHYYRLDLMDGPTHYRSNNADLHTLTFGTQGELFCSNTTATVSIATTVDGSLTVLDSSVTFERNLVLNGDLFIDTDAVAAGGNIITVAGDLTLGPGSRIFIKGKSQEPVTIAYNGVRSGTFAEKTCVDANYGVSYSAGGNGAITLTYAPLGTLMIVR